MLGPARLLAFIVVLASAPVLILASMDAYGLPIDDDLATLLMQVRGWFLGPIFSLGLSLLAELWLQIPPKSPQRKTVARIWWIALLGHVALAAPSLGAKITGATLKEALTWDWLLEHPLVFLYGVAQVLVPDLVAVGLVTGSGEVLRAQKQQQAADPYSGSAVQIEAEVEDALAQNESSSTPEPAPDPEDEIETFSCPSCSKEWTKPRSQKSRTLNCHAPYCKGTAA